jgi:multicomponent Na+:H+ antiporter subunit G
VSPALLAAASGVVADVTVAALLVAGVALMLLACVGLLVMGGVYDRLHFAGLAGFGAAATCVAVLVRESFSLIGNKALFVAVFLVLTSPVLVHVTARAARIREHGDWAPQAEEDLPVEEP